MPSIIAAIVVALLAALCHWLRNRTKKKTPEEQYDKEPHWQGWVWEIAFIVIALVLLVQGFMTIGTSS